MTDSYYLVPGLGLVDAGWCPFLLMSVDKTVVDVKRGEGEAIPIISLL